jgi:hypothetical protein
MYSSHVDRAHWTAARSEGHARYYVKASLRSPSRSGVQSGTVLASADSGIRKTDLPWTPDHESERHGGRTISGSGADIGEATDDLANDRLCRIRLGHFHNRGWFKIIEADDVCQRLHLRCRLDDAVISVAALVNRDRVGYTKIPCYCDIHTIKRISRLGTQTASLTGCTYDNRAAGGACQGRHLCGKMNEIKIALCLITVSLVLMSPVRLAAQSDDKDILVQDIKAYQERCEPVTASAPTPSPSCVNEKTGLKARQQQLNLTDADLTALLKGKDPVRTRH